MPPSGALTPRYLSFSAQRMPSRNRRQRPSLGAAKPKLRPFHLIPQSGWAECGVCDTFASEVSLTV